jgi:CheY-like chemotaxis protein
VTQSLEACRLPAPQSRWVAGGSGREALVRAETEDFALVLLDLNLPDMDGIEVAEQLEGNDADVVMLTARGDLASRVRGLYAGAADYLSKPFQMEELLARVYARMRSRARARTGVVERGGLTLATEERWCAFEGERIDLSAQARPGVRLVRARAVGGAAPTAARGRRPRRRAARCAGARGRLRRPGDAGLRRAGRRRRRARRARLGVTPPVRSP